MPSRLRIRAILLPLWMHTDANRTLTPVSVMTAPLPHLPTDQPLPVFVPFAPAHLPAALRLSQAAAWPHRIEDWALNLAHSRGLVALEQGAVVATGFVSPMGAVAAVNMIIVDQRLRGRGLGRALMSALLDLAGAGELRLVATPEGLPLYEKLGFATTGQIAQHQGIAQAHAPELPVTLGGPQDLDRLAAMDLAAAGLDRAALLAELTRHGTVLNTKGGICVLRRFGRGTVVGPLIAETLPAARALLSAAATQCAGQFLRADFVAGQGLEPHATALGLTYAGGGTAMTRSAQPRDAGPATTYTLLSQALG